MGACMPPKPTKTILIQREAEMATKKNWPAITAAEAQEIYL